MSRYQDLAQQRVAVDTVADLTSVFEGIASMRISQIKDQVLQSEAFFSELWHIYSQLRVGEAFRYGRARSDMVIDKQLYIVITSEGSFSGDIDERLITTMLSSFDAHKQDIMVIGHHGATQLIQKGVSFKRYFTLPAKDRNINLQPLIMEIRKYNSTVAFYQSYVSLMVQEVKNMDLSNAVQQAASKVGDREDVITDRNYIFEPSTFDVVAHLERSMLQIALNQLILDSKLAQYASRFRAMSMAKHRVDDILGDLYMAYNRARRTTQDERLKEVLNGSRKVSSV
jgi:F-type H+-transporting ATPase subunit gamma